MKIEDYEILVEQYKESLLAASRENNKIASFNNAVNTIEKFDDLMKKVKIEPPENFDLEEEDQIIIDYYRSISEKKDIF